MLTGGITNKDSQVYQELSPASTFGVTWKDNRLLSPTGHIATVTYYFQRCRETIHNSFYSPVLFGCISYDRKQEVFKTDKDFAEFSRQLSPDSSKLLLNYGVDLGTTGYGRAGTAILNLSDTLTNLRLCTLPNTFDRVKCIDNKTVSAEFDTIRLIRDVKASTLKDTTINGVTLKVSSYHFIEPNSEQIIVHREK